MVRRYAPPGNLVAIAELRRMRGSEQVAAVCFRVRNGEIEFLLVETRGGRWIFPKGSAEPGLTHAQAAALEAFEEAGVHGRIEEASFGKYVHYKNGELKRSTPVRIVVHAHLCEVSRLETPKEPGRNPTWFCLEKAKRRLKKDRNSDYGDQLADIVERAVITIQRSHGGLSRPLRRMQLLNS